MTPNWRYLTADQFQSECDYAYVQGVAFEAQSRAERIRSYEQSAEQLDWESDEDADAE